MKQDRKKQFITYLSTATLLVVAIFLGVYLLITQVRVYLKNVFISEAINIAEGYSQLIDVSTSANESIEELMEHQLEMALNLAQLHEKDVLNGTMSIEDLLKLNKVNVINYFNSEGVLIASNFPEYLNTKLAPNHPIQRFINSNKQLEHEPIRVGSDTPDRLKHAYLKTESGNIIQAAIGSKVIYEITEKYSPETIVQYLIDDESILDAEIVLRENISFPLLNNSARYEVDAFRQAAINQNKISHHFKSVDQMQVLEIAAPIIHNEGQIGALIIQQNYEPMNNLIKNAIQTAISLAILALIILLVLLWSNYFKDRTLSDVSYLSNNPNIFNRNYLYQFIDQNITQILNENNALLIVTLNNFERFKLIFDEEKFYDAMTLFDNLILESTPNRREVFKYDDSTLIVLYEAIMQEDQFESAFVNFSNHISSFNIYDSHFEIKTGVILLGPHYKGSYFVKASLENAISTMKLESSDPFIIFKDQLWDQIIYQQELQNALRKAFLNRFEKDFSVVYQAKVDSKEHKIIGFEALSRWNHPLLGNIPPNDFIPIAETKDMIMTLGERVILDSFDFIKKLYELGYDDLVISINVSYKQLKVPQFVERFLFLMKSSNVNPQNVGIEITESILVDDFDELSHKLHLLQDQGVKIYLDDFGIGYSSLEKVQNIPIDFIKVDRSFIQMIEEDDSVAAAIFGLIEDLHYQVIAEGVETTHQINWLSEKGCHLIQGYYYSKPKKEEDAILLLKSFNA